jgi:hypothetical protein
VRLAVAASIVVQETMDQPCSDVVHHVETHYTPQIRCENDTTNVKPKRTVHVKSVVNEAQASHNCLFCRINFWGCIAGTVFYCDNATDPEDQKMFVVCDEDARGCKLLFTEATTGYDEIFFGYADTSEWYRLEYIDGPEGH